MNSKEVFEMSLQLAEDFFPLARRECPSGSPTFSD
jgi:hypothetical protein